jgi:hypothetical protein
MEDPRKLRELAGWYREYAERAGNPAIWEGRLRTAKDLEREADRIEKVAARCHQIAQRVVEQDSGSMRNSRFEHGGETEGVRHEV